MRTYKKRQKIWVKARYEADAKDDDTECHITINEHEDGEWMDAYDVRVRLADIRPRVKRKSPWLPIETAPKDGATVLLHETGGYVWVGRWHDTTQRWAANGMGIVPSHWMPIPKLEVDDV